MIVTPSDAFNWLLECYGKISYDLIEPGDCQNAEGNEGVNVPVNACTELKLAYFFAPRRFELSFNNLFLGTARQKYRQYDWEIVEASRMNICEFSVWYNNLRKTGEKRKRLLDI